MYKSPRIFIRFFLLNLFLILMSNLSWAQLTGGLFREFYFTYQAKEISTSEWPRGYYFIRVITADGKATEKKIIIQ